MGANNGVVTECGWVGYEVEYGKWVTGCDGVVWWWVRGGGDEVIDGG